MKNKINKNRHIAFVLRHFMRVLIVSILFISLLQPVRSFAQKTFATQGEQEDFWATEIFKNSYST
ncbi:MAG TPA: hypothetical protein VIH86_04715 [Puia sp.]